MAVLKLLLSVFDFFFPFCEESKTKKESVRVNINFYTCVVQVLFLSGYPNEK